MTSRSEISRGICPRTHVLSCFVPMDVIEMGAAPAVLRALMMAVHSVNRNSPDEDFLAADMPDYQPRMQGALRMGRQLDIFGSESALRRVLGDGRVAPLFRSGKVAGGQIRETERAPEFGLARVRRGEKSTPSGQARARRRMERRGGVWEDRPHAGKGLTGSWEDTSFLDVGEQRRIEFRRVPLKDGATVSTYGLVLA